jgi:hypothetical protein
MSAGVLENTDRSALLAAIEEVTAHGQRATRAALVAQAICAHDYKRATVEASGKARKAAQSAGRGWNTGSTTRTVMRDADRAELWRDRAAAAAGLSAAVVEVATVLLADWHGAMSDVVPAALALAGEGVTA